MRLLLDTHALIWWWLDDHRLSATARSAIQDSGNHVVVSSASAWEMATKHRLGKLGSVGDALPRFHELIRLDDFDHLPMDWRHALHAGRWDCTHRDPFDRMLAAQAALEGLTLVSCDPAFPAFGVQQLW